MCTVSWTLGKDGYHLLCNRDEKKTRVRACPPSISSEAGVEVIAPRDPQGGGTWITSNSRGISIALLNGCNIGNLDEAASPEPGQRSRGLLPARLIRHRSTKAMVEELEAMRLHGFPPFTLLFLAPGEAVRLHAWDGRERWSLTDDAPYGLISSSSYDPAGVRRHRQAAFDSIRRQATAVTSDLLYTLHESHGHVPSAYSVCMHRPDAETVSFTWIRAAQEEVAFFYTPYSPCRWLPGETLHLQRRT